VVIIASSVPLLRPLFHRRRQRIPDEGSEGWDAITLNSVFSKSKFRERSTALQSPSQENIVPHSTHAGHVANGQQPGITVTREVAVTVETTDVQFVHAALVGLVQGELANPQMLARRGHQ